MPDKKGQRGVESKNIQPGSGKQGKSESLTYIPADQKIEVEIREIIRIKPQDFAALKNSFEAWAKEWET